MLKAAIVGTGAIAREHLAALRALPEVRLAGVCDLSPVLAMATAEEFEVESWTTDFSQLLREATPDVVHVTTPPHTHALLAKQALEAGAHVFVEKPITPHPAQLEDLFASAKKAERMLVEDHNYAFNRPIRRILQHIEQGSFGQVVHVDVSIALDIQGEGSRYTDANLPHPCLRLPGGAIADFLTHLSYLAWIFVGKQRSVSTVWNKRQQDSPLPFDELRALVEAERGTALLRFSSNAQPDRFVVEVEGTKMRARASLFDPLLGIEQVHGGPRPLIPVRNGLALARAHRNAGLGGLWRKLAGRPMSYEGLHELIARFYRAVACKGAPPVSQKQILEVNGLVAALTDDLTQGDLARRSGEAAA